VPASDDFGLPEESLRGSATGSASSFAFEFRTSISFYFLLFFFLASFAFERTANKKE